MIIFFDEQTLRDATSVSDFYEKIHIEKYQIKSVTQMFMNEEQCEEMREIYEKKAKNEMERLAICLDWANMSPVFRKDLPRNVILVKEVSN